MLPLDEALWAVIEEQWAARRYDEKRDGALRLRVPPQGKADLPQHVPPPVAQSLCGRWPWAVRRGRGARREEADEVRREVLPRLQEERREKRDQGRSPRERGDGRGRMENCSVLDRYNITSSTDKLEALRRSRAYTALQQDTNVSDIRA